VAALAFLLLLLAPDPVAEQAAILKKNAKLPYEQGKRLSAIHRLGGIASRESTRVLEALLGDPFGHVQDAAVSALIALKRVSPSRRAPSIDLLGAFLQRRHDPRTRIHLATALGLIGDKRAVEGLLGVLKKEKDDAAIEAIAGALGRLADERAYAGLLDKVNRGPGRAHALRALGGLPNGAEAAAPFRRDSDDAVRAAVVDVMVARRREVCGDVVVDASVGVKFGIALSEALPAVKDGPLARRRAEALLKHPSWRVRAAAIEGVVALRDATLLPDLVDVLASEKGRLRFDAWRALVRLTGKRIGPDPGQWKSILPLATLPKKGAEVGLKSGGTAAFYKLPVYSRRMGFVFDVSGSMRDEDRLVQARAQFLETASGLKKDQRYDLFVYRFYLDFPPRPKLERCFGKLVAGKSRAAAGWLGKQEAKGGGALFDAIAAAIADDEVDVIYLLSDGVPSYGTVSRGWRVVQEVKRLNRFRRVAIFGVMIGEGRKGLEFMRNLARATGGLAVDGKGRRLG